MKNTIESEEFYNLMQGYRTTPIQDQALVIKAYENVIRYIDIYVKTKLEQATKEALEES